MWQYIDHSGTPIIANGFQGADSFSEELAAVINTTDWLYINKTGQVVLPGPYQKASRFSEGHAVVLQNNTWKIIDRQGTTVNLPATDEPVDPKIGFVNGLLPVHEGQKLGYILPDGAYAWTPSN